MNIASKSKTNLGWYKTASPEEQKEFHSWLKRVLETEIVHLTFTKKDGTIREMKCTLREDRLPEVQKDFDEDAPTRSKTKDTISFWDIESEGWRSCRYDSIKEIKFTLGV
jgi:hypothetical protein